MPDMTHHVVSGDTLIAAVVLVAIVAVFTCLFIGGCRLAHGILVSFDCVVASDFNGQVVGLSNRVSGIRHSAIVLRHDAKCDVEVE